MLPKRSTPVDQTFGSESRHSQLSVAIFIAPRNLLGARKSLISKKKCKKCGTLNQPVPLVTFLRDIKRYFQNPKIEGGGIEKGVSLSV